MSTISSEQAEQIIQLFLDRFIRKDYTAMLELFDEDVTIRRQSCATAASSNVG